MEEITYCRGRRISAAALAELFRRSGLRRPVDDLPRIQAMIDHCNELLTAWSGEQLVGVARALTDYRYCCYLSDLAVDPDFQRRGIGRRLIKLLEELLEGEAILLLLSAPEAREYYPHIGFERVENAWHKPRNR